MVRLQNSSEFAGEVVRWTTYMAAETATYSESVSLQRLDCSPEGSGILAGSENVRGRVVSDASNMHFIEPHADFPFRFTGCVPKKVRTLHLPLNEHFPDFISQIMWHAADIADKIRHAKDYQFKDVSEPQFNWATFKPQRDAYIKRLNGIYDRNLDKDGVDFFHGFGRVVSPSQVEVTQKDGSKALITADHIVVATGGRPTIPSDDVVPGASLGINSDGFFALEDQPKRVAVVGAGYIAVELAGVLNTLGSEVHLFIRGETVLRTFDATIQETLTPWMEHTGVKIHKKTHVTKVEGVKGQTLTVTTDGGEKVEVDTVLWAVGRHANTEGLGLEELGVELDKKGDVVTNEWQESNVKGIYALGDVSGRALLTPVAIAAARRLANRLFGPEKFKADKLNYDNIPTVVFS